MGKLMDTAFIGTALVQSTQKTQEGYDVNVPKALATSLSSLLTQGGVEKLGNRLGGRVGAILKMASIPASIVAGYASNKVVDKIEDQVEGVISDFKTRDFSNKHISDKGIKQQAQILTLINVLSANGQSYTDSRSGAALNLLQGAKFLGANATLFQDKKGHVFLQKITQKATGDALIDIYNLPRNARVNPNNLDALKYISHERFVGRMEGNRFIPEQIHQKEKVKLGNEVYLLNFHYDRNKNAGKDMPVTLMDSKGNVVTDSSVLKQILKSAGGCAGFIGSYGKEMEAMRFNMGWHINLSAGKNVSLFDMAYNKHDGVQTQNIGGLSQDRVPSQTKSAHKSHHANHKRSGKHLYSNFFLELCKNAHGATTAFLIGSGANEETRKTTQKYYRDNFK